VVTTACQLPPISIITDVKHHIARKLLRLNAEFYQRFAAEFAESRRAIQPGFQQALEIVAGGCSTLDVGCGDGRAAQALSGTGWDGEYVGVDSNPALLARARARNLSALRARFIQADLATAHWPQLLPRKRFDAALALAVLHHIPGAGRRKRLIRQVAARLRPGGRVVLSAWQFLGNERLRRKIVPWGRLGLREADVDPGDYLLDWKRGGEGLRYVCALDEPGLRRLAEAGGLQVEAVYRADGQTGEMSLYMVASRA
jgi:SAM-dependent methyltransferase